MECFHMFLSVTLLTTNHNDDHIDWNKPTSIAAWTQWLEFLHQSRTHCMVHRVEADVVEDQFLDQILQRHCAALCCSHGLKTCWFLIIMGHIQHIQHQQADQHHNRNFNQPQPQNNNERGGWEEEGEVLNNPHLGKNMTRTMTWQVCQGMWKPAVATLTQASSARWWAFASRTSKDATAWVSSRSLAWKDEHETNYTSVGPKQM